MTAATPGRGERSLQRAAEILRQEGLRSLWFKLLGETVYRRLDLVSRDIPLQPVHRQPASDLQFGFLQAGEVAEFLRFRDYADRETVLDRLRQGQHCFLVRDRGAIVHCCWAATGAARIDYLDCSVRLADDVVYVYEAYTGHGNRGRSLSSLRSFVLEDFFRRRGLRRLLGVVWPENPSIYRSMEKAGYRVIGRMGYVGMGRLRRHFLRHEGGEPPLRIVGRWSGRIGGSVSAAWDAVPGALESRQHYLDPFLAELKRQENLRLVRQWGGLSRDGALLKTDAFEEAMGADAFLADLQGEAGAIVGMDVSPAVARRAAERYRDAGLCFLAADARRLPFADARFSTVASPSTLDHFTDPSDLGVSLRELYRVLEPGGRLVITLDNRQNLFDPVLRLVHRLGLVPYFIGRSYTVDELRRELRDAGFEVRETTAILHNPRLVAVGSMRIVRCLRWRPLIRAMQKLIQAAQGLEQTRLCFYTGSFVAALAVRPSADRATPPVSAAQSGVQTEAAA
jgi:SAM-dependent methyltransferase